MSSCFSELGSNTFCESLCRRLFVWKLKGAMSKTSSQVLSLGMEQKNGMEWNKKWNGKWNKNGMENGIEWNFKNGIKNGME